MRRLSCRLMAICLLLASVAAFAQSGGSMGQDNMKSDDASKKAMSVTGKISDDGKMFTSDKDNKAWTISNPEAVKGHEGHHVTLKAHVYPDKNEVHVMSLKMAKGGMSDNMKNDNMQH
ncbi:MAG: hypothetical protein JOZ80_07970 [Acidobacteriaceae bacterium]|nr:hypothetical protein [Acidobacteriaceae bacterium]